MCTGLKGSSVGVKLLEQRIMLADDFEIIDGERRVSETHETCLQQLNHVLNLHVLVSLCSLDSLDSF